VLPGKSLSHNKGEKTKEKRRKETELKKKRRNSARATRRRNLDVKAPSLERESQK